ncbi:unnamed protein product [Heligmosomoides polygyrus]|uniref:Uncharacterized protein n=1 Tax=Heligmosomoides polygyrus TaxID=6339 RepID=A0A183GUL1_HELPZ|nr:unnamed protein product [Heligmosomoides polygyrus]
METKMLRWTAGVTRLDRIRSDAIRQKFGVAPITDNCLWTLYIVVTSKLAALEAELARRDELQEKSEKDRGEALQNLEEVGLNERTALIFRTSF